MADIPLMRDLSTLGRTCTSRIGRERGTVLHVEAQLAVAANNNGKSRCIA